MPSAKTTQTSQASLTLTADSLRPINSLTRASPKPGFLEYTTYLQLLIRDGHVENNHPACSQEAPVQPLNSSLQMVNRQDRSDDRTDFRADQALWNQNDLPHILYLLEPPPTWINQKYLKEPPMKNYQIHGKDLRDIPILPDHISSKVEGWRMQAWCSFDPRVKLGDILGRIGKAVGHNTIVMRSSRFRADFPALGWANANANKGPKFDAEKIRIDGLIAEAGLDPASGTTRGIALGVVDPDNEGSRRIPFPNSKAWESSVEVPTAAHLNSIPSPTLSGPSQPAPIDTPTPRTDHETKSSNGDAEYMISDDEEDQIQDHGEMLDYEGLDSSAVVSLSEYPRPEEVPRPISITDPLLYQQMFDDETVPLQFHPCF